MHQPGEEFVPGGLFTTADADPDDEVDPEFTVIHVAGPLGNLAVPTSVEGTEF